MRSHRHVLLVVAVAGLVARPVWAQDPFADAVQSFVPGIGAGFGAELLPGIVLGPPRGAGELEGSFDVVSMGSNGVIVIRFDAPVICDGAGPDLTIFENPFHSGSPTGPIFEEYGIVALSQDGRNFFEFPYDAETHAGLAGRAPVLSHPGNGVDPLDPSASGGDVFDLADIGLAWAAYVRITDPGATISDPGNVLPGGDQAGFDLDALAALHACEPGGATATPTPSSTAVDPRPTVTPTATPDVSTMTATVVATPIAGDLDGDGSVTGADADLLIAELYDGDGDGAAAAPGGRIASSPAADVNADGRIAAADLIALTMRRSQ